MKVDCQSHLFPAGYAEALTRNPGSPTTTGGAGNYTVAYGDLQSFRLDLEDYSVARKLRDMDAAGIDVSVVSVNMPGPELLEPELAVEAARVCNDELAEACARHRQRLVGLACLPWQRPDAAIAELDRAAGELDMRGVMLYSHVGTGPVDGDALEPVYARIAQLGVPVVLHPCVPPWAAETSDHSMTTMVGLMVDHSLAALRLVLGGVLERHPRLQVVQPHCGGVLPYLWGRIRNQTEVMKRGVDRISRTPTELYRRVHLDTASPWPPAVRVAYELTGADRLVFASDHPWVEIQLLIDALEELGLPAGDLQHIYSGNACRLFRID
ncbi:MAG: amidohydrolase family protein [Spirochaetaceae bacterium]|nr:amidohydrolase family protein [Spirochaetaceae bacterium]